MAGRGKCPDCVWFNEPEGCNVERDSPVCLLNKRPREAENGKKEKKTRRDVPKV